MGPFSLNGCCITRDGNLTRSKPCELLDTEGHFACAYDSPLPEVFQEALPGWLPSRNSPYTTGNLRNLIKPTTNHEIICGEGPKKLWNPRPDHRVCSVVYFRPSAILRGEGDASVADHQSKNRPDDNMIMEKVEPIAILGAGAWGLSTALHMLDAGYSNLKVFDQASEIPSQFSAAHDLNKIVRAEYEDEFYTELALVSDWPKQTTSHENSITDEVIPGSYQALEDATLGVKFPSSRLCSCNLDCGPGKGGQASSNSTFVCEGPFCLRSWHYLSQWK